MDDIRDADHEQELVREFLTESHENLGRLDLEILELEKRPADAPILASVFRTIHTIKGTCGFLSFGTLERISHQAETLLSKMRDGQRQVTAPLISLILETVDAIRKVLASIEASGEEGSDKFEDLIERLQAAASRRESAPAHSEPSKPDDDSTKSSAVADSNVRVGVGLLDKLMDLVGELVLTRNQILQFNAQREDPILNASSQRLNLITSELQEGVMKTRMQPIGTVWNKLPRVVRDMAVSFGKQIHLDMDGAETELDRTIVEAIKDPLVHLVRNACDHGLERPEVRVQAGKPAHGRLALRAYHEGGQVNIEISDDGSGVDVARVKQKALEKGLLRPEQIEKLNDREALQLLFHPGFSTAAKVTNVSGRGVGMDVVKSNVERIGGVVDLVSRPGEGMTVKLKIPLTLAIIPGLVVVAHNQRSAPREAHQQGDLFVIPQVSLVELIRLETANGSDRQIEHIHGTRVYRRRGDLLPIAYLNEVLGLGHANESGITNIVVLQAEDRQFGLVVDGISDTQEIVVKPLSKQLKALTIYAGATIMGDGRVALILDVLGIGHRSGVLSENHEQARASAQQQQQSANQQRVLLFRAGSFERLAVPLSLVARLEEFPRRSIEHAGGRQVIQYRDGILPLIPLAGVLEPGQSRDGIPADPVQVIVFNTSDSAQNDSRVGLVVDQILDVVEDVIETRQQSTRNGFLGSAVVGKRLADFLDLSYVIGAAGGAGVRPPGTVRRVLLADPAPFSRGLVRGSLDMAGHRVFEAGSMQQALDVLERESVDMVAVSLDLPAPGSCALVSAMQKRAAWARIPVVALADSAEQVHARKYDQFRACLAKADREGMLASVQRLADALDAAEPAIADRSGVTGEKK